MWFLLKAFKYFPVQSVMDMASNGNVKRIFFLYSFGTNLSVKFSIMCAAKELT